MKQIERVFVGLAAASLVLLLPRPASACDCAQIFAVSPAPDAGEVPTNTWVRVTGSAIPDLVFSQVDGGIVDAEVREPLGNSATRYLVPRAPLTKGVEYILSDEFNELTRFVVTSDPDTEPTGFGGVREFVYRESSPFEAQSSCGPSRAYNLELFEPAADATPRGDFFFHVYAGAGPDEVDLSRPVVVLPPGIRSFGQTACGPFFDLDANPEPWVVVTAVDRAGNESAPSEPTQLTMGCGCSAGSGGAQAVLVLMGLAVWTSRRRIPARLLAQRR